MLSAQEKIANYGNAKFYRQKYTLTPPERVMFSLLKLACRNHHILPQYPLSQLIRTWGGSEKQNSSLWLTANRLVLDYLIVDKSFNPICAVELDDSTHRSWKRKNADEYKDLVLNQIDISIYRFTVADMPRYQDVPRMAKYLVP